MSIERGDCSIEDEKKSVRVVGFHSEKLVIAFGLLSKKLESR